MPDPANYAHLLPHVPAGALRAWVVPATTRLRPELIIIADPRHATQLDAIGEQGARELNGQAVHLTVSLHTTGCGEQVGLA